MSSAEFNQLESALAQAPVDSALDQLAGQLQASDKLHELFDVRLMQARLRLGLPAGENRPLDELPEPLRTQAGEAYQRVCREIGELFLAQGRAREAWMYLRPAGASQQMGVALETIEPTADNADDLIEIALHDAVNAPRGFQWLLDQRGTCNAITAFESLLTQRPRAEQQAAAALLVRQLCAELIENVRKDIAQQEKKAPAESSLTQLIEGRDWLFSGAAYHVDTTHLASVVRIARVVEDPELVRLALELAEYGCQLDARYQFAGEEPFVDSYPAHRLYFQALLGQNVEQAVAHFRDRAQAANIDPDGTQPAEEFVRLLARLARHTAALHAAARLLPPDVRTSGIAPSLWELSRAAGDFRPLMDLCRQRGDLVGFAAALIEGRGSEVGGRRSAEQ